jgi:hypothetical protein
MVVAATVTCQIIASLCNYVHCVGPTCRQYTFTMSCPLPGNEHSHPEVSVFDVTSTASGKESEICGLCLVCDALRIVNAFTQEHTYTRTRTHTHTRAPWKRSYIGKRNVLGKQPVPCSKHDASNRVLRSGVHRLFKPAFFIFKCQKISRHTRKCNFIYTHTEFTAFRMPNFTKSVNSH